MSLKSKTLHSIKWNMLATIICSTIAFVRLPILSFFLEKSDFGILAIAMMVISFTDVFSELGLTIAIIHKQDITDKQYSSIYILNILMSVVLTLLLCFISPLIALFYHQPILRSVVSLLSLQILFNGFGKMFQTIKSKELDYRFISIVKTVSSLLGFALTLILAVLDYGIFSLIFGQLLTVVITQSSYLIAGRKTIRLSIHFSFSEIKDFVRIGSYQLGARLLDILSTKIDVILIGKFFSMDVLGVYNIAKELILQPGTIISSISSNVFSSAFAIIQKDLLKVTSNFRKLLSVISLGTAPVYLLVFIFSDIIVNILYSSSFSEVSLFLRILCLTGFFTAIDTQGGILQVAFGRTDLSLYWTIIRSFISFLIIYITGNINIYAVAYGQVFVSLISVFIRYYLIIKKILVNVTLKEYLSMFVPPFLFCVSCVLVYQLGLLFLQPSIIYQVTSVMFYSVIYLYFITRSYKSLSIEILSLLKHR